MVSRSRSSSRPQRPKGQKACIVTGELEGPSFNGGVGTTNRALAITLGRLGYQVDILYTRVENRRPFSLRGEFSDHLADYAELGIRLACIDHAGQLSEWQARSYLCLQYLLARPYDVVFFDDLWGSGYYPLLARRTCAHQLRDTIMCVTAHGCTQWYTDLNREFVTDDETLVLLEMERRALELADAVKAPSSYILNKYREYGWILPKNTIVLPNFVPGGRQPKRTPRSSPVKEIVFFGRLETRKGLWTFCRALDHLKFQLKDYQITFLGKMTPDTIGLVEHIASWPFPVRILSNFNQEQAVRYLKGDGRIAVMPAREDNSPSAILECLQENIPFIASSGTGGEELVHPEYRETCLFEPTVEALSRKLVDVIETGATVARPSVDRAETEKAFSIWLQNLLKGRSKSRSIAAERALATGTIYIVVIPSGYDPERARAKLRGCAELNQGNARIIALAPELWELPFSIEENKQDFAIEVRRHNEFASVARTEGRQEGSIVIIAHIDQLPGPDWLVRSRECFASMHDIYAVTGMTAAMPSRSGLVAQESAFSASSGHHVRRYLLGNASSFFCLDQQTNGGFVVLRSEALPISADVSPVMNHYERLKPMEHWVHEILVTLYLSGRRFELLPDRLLEKAAHEMPFEVNELTEFMRSLPDALYGYSPGTEVGLLARSAVDERLQTMRGRFNLEYEKEMQARIGVPVSVIGVDRPSYLLAHASGQIELALDLAARDATGTSERGLTAYIGLEATTTRLVEGSGPNVPGEILMSSGEFPEEFLNLDLRQANLFRCDLERVADRLSPVRMRCDIIDAASGDCRTFELLLWSDEDRVPWEFGIPEKYRTLAHLKISMSLLDYSEAGLIEHASIWIRDPCFLCKPIG